MGIGSAGTTAVSQDNPLYEAVKAGGGYVETDDGGVTGGPDGDGTARTQQERMNQANNPMGNDPEPDPPEPDPPAQDVVTTVTDAVKNAAPSTPDPPTPDPLPSPSTTTIGGSASSSIAVVVAVGAVALVAGRFL